MNCIGQTMTEESDSEKPLSLQQGAAVRDVSLIWPNYPCKNDWRETFPSTQQSDPRSSDANVDKLCETLTNECQFLQQFV